MDNIIFLKMTSSHVDGIYEISRLSFHTPWSQDSISKELTNSFARYIVAVNEGTVIGFGGLWIILDEAHITNIAVRPDFRNKGIGDNLLNELIKLCLSEGVSAMTLEVRKSNNPAQSLYLKHGFQVEGIRKGYYQDSKEDGIIMWKRFN